MFRTRLTDLPTPAQALPGREQPILAEATHVISGRSLFPPFPPESCSLLLGMGCFWGAERLFWELPGTWVTAVGYAGGTTPNPTYDEVCTGYTGHTEVVRVVFMPQELPLSRVLQVFWEQHDPTQGMRQWNDHGTQYRSAIYLEPDGDPALIKEAEQSRAVYQRRLAEAGRGAITTEIAADTPFFPAELYHQQYLARNPGGYCGLRGTGVSCG